MSTAREVRSFHPDDLGRIVTQPFQNLEQMSLMQQDWVHYWGAGGLGFSGINCSKVLCSGGFFPAWSGRFTAWFLLDQSMTRYDLLWMVKRVRNFLENSMPDTVRRIDATAREDFPQASRMLEMLGFEREGLMKSYGPDGSSHYLFARLM